MTRFQTAKVACHQDRRTIGCSDRLNPAERIAYLFATFGRKRLKQ